MPTIISVTRRLSVEPLLDINDPEFARWYSHGVFWAMYGDYQGLGPYDDRYLIENISRNIEAGRYGRPDSPWFASAGFYFGMVHGGMIEPGTHALRICPAIVVLTDPDFARGYEAGLLIYEQLTDYMIKQQLQTCAQTRLADQSLAHQIGRMVGMLSHALKLTPIPATSI